MVDDVFVAGGSTTFPLAIPINENEIYECNNLQDVAKRLLERGIYHTKPDANKNAASDGQILEKASLDVFNCDNINDLSGLNGQYNYRFSNKQHYGVGVMPAGKVIYFHNVDDNGMPDQMNNESRIVAKTKSILVFFKEIPVQAFRDGGRERIAEEAEKTRSQTQDMYY